MNNLVIIGTGQSAAQCALTLRRNMFKDNMLADGGGLFPQMTPNDPLMNSFNKTPLSVLERDNGGVTRQQYMQQYAPKTAAQMLGIVDTYDEEGIMGV